MFDEVVTVVDDSIVVARLIILIIIADIELIDFAQVIVSHSGQVHQVATQFTQQDGAVCQRLQLCEDTRDRIDRVLSNIQVLLVSIENIIALLREEILTRSKHGKSHHGCGDAADH